MLELLALGIAGVAGFGGYAKTRKFVRNRLRFVDGVQKASAPLIAGGIAAAAAAPVVWVLPVVGAGTALALGAGIGVGVSRGAKDVRRGLPRD